MPNLQLGSSGGPAKNFHGVGVGPLSKMLAFISEFRTEFRQNVIKVGSKSWLLSCSSNIILSLPSYTGSALKRELNFCNGYLSLLYFWTRL